MLSGTPGGSDSTYAKSVVQFQLQRLREAACSAYVRIVMPPEHDPLILDALRRAFADPTSNAVEFKRTARTGGYRDDEGLENLLPAELPLSDKQRLLKEAIVRYVDQGITPTVVTYEGDDVRGEPVRFHEFRLVVAGVGLYVKVYLEPDELNDPTARVCSVKRADPR